MSAPSAEPMPVVPTDAPDLASLRAEHAAAIRSFEAAREAERNVDVDLAKKNAGMRPVEPYERELALDALRQATLSAARRVQAAGEAVQAAQVAKASGVLPGLVASHEQAAADLIAARDAFESQLERLVVAGWRFREAVLVERQAATAIANVARDAAPNDEVRDSIRHSLEHGVPVAVDRDGPTAWTFRPERGLWGGHLDPFEKNAEVYRALNELVRRPRERAGAVVGEVILQRLEAAANEAES